MTPILDRFRATKSHRDLAEQARGSAPLGGHGRRSAYVVTSAERAPCTCPEFCERDHTNE